MSDNKKEIGMVFKTTKCRHNEHEKCKAALCDCKCHDKKPKRERPLKQNPYGFGEAWNERSY